MQIDRSNYQAHILDMIEGEISPEREKELMHFLACNPDLEAGLDLSDMTVPLPKINFPGKEDIKKGALTSKITKGNYEQYCIARLEGDLSATSDQALDKFLSRNPECLSSARMYDMLVIKADERIHFPGKHLLKRNSSSFKYLQGKSKRKVVRIAVSIAASILLLFSSSVFIMNLNREEKVLPGDLPAEISLTLEEGNFNSLPGITKEDIYHGLNSGINTVSIMSLPLIPENIEYSSIVYEDEKVFIEKEPVPKRLPAKIISNIETVSSTIDIKPIQLTSLYAASLTGYKKQKTIRENIIHGVTDFFTGIINDTSDDKEGISIWDLADAGVRGINNLAGTEMQFEREYNKEGDIVSMAFNSRVIEFKRITSFQE